MDQAYSSKSSKIPIYIKQLIAFHLNYKEVIILKGIMDMSSKEVSSVMKSNENNINVLYHRSLKKLKTMLEKEGYEYGGLLINCKRS